MLYFAYGSNMDPERLTERAVSFRARTPARLPGYRLAFNKPAKASVRVGFANLVKADAQSRVHGALYELTDAAWARLLRFEGGYAPHTVHVDRADGQAVAACTLIAPTHHDDDARRPTPEYVERLLAARDLLPPDYVAALEAQPTTDAPPLTTLERVERALDFCDNELLGANSSMKRNEEYYFRSQVAIVILSAATPVIVLTQLPYLDTKVIAAIVSAVVAGLVSVNHLFKFREQYLRYAARAWALYREKFDFINKNTKPYQGDLDDAVDHFAERVNALIDQDVSAWVRDMRSEPDQSATPGRGSPGSRR